MTFSFFASQAGKIHVCGHRGHMIGAPENTVAALKAAHDHGATTCEIDAVLTGDGEIVVIHDLLVDRTTNGSGAVKDLDAAEIAKLDAGAWFSSEFAGEPVPTLSDVLAAARRFDLGLEIEIKEKRDLTGFTKALKRDLAEAEDLQRVMMISFDHASLKQIKSAIPGLKTGGIAHERYGDPLAVVQSADLDQLCIDLAVFELDDARRLHDAGHSIRCHAYRPSVMEASRRAGLDWEVMLAEALREGLVDTLSGDDVEWLRRFVDDVLSTGVVGKETMAG